MLTTPIFDIYSHLTMCLTPPHPQMPTALHIANRSVPAFLCVSLLFDHLKKKGIRNDSKNTNNFVVICSLSSCCPSIALSLCHFNKRTFTLLFFASARPYLIYFDGFPRFLPLVKPGPTTNLFSWVFSSFPLLDDSSFIFLSFIMTLLIADKKNCLDLHRLHAFWRTVKKQKFSPSASLCMLWR